MKNFWDDRYAEKDRAYGRNPNTFFAEQIGQLRPGKILLPCEGEGRNAVYAAKKGWEVEGFDLSIVGMNKATAYAHESSVHINYQIADVIDVYYPENTFDAVGLIYAHFPPEIRKIFHEKTIKWLKSGGALILEAFNPLQINNSSGGPKDLSSLYSAEMLTGDFKTLKVQLLTEAAIVLDEGKYHQGKADVIRFAGIKRE